MTNTAIRYTPEFKQTLIDLHYNGRTFKELHLDTALPRAPFTSCSVQRPLLLLTIKELF
jgi:hypothetical protein